jgi:hypothetical protein
MDPDRRGKRQLETSMQEGTEIVLWSVEAAVHGGSRCSRITSSQLQSKKAVKRNKNERHLENNAELITLSHPVTKALGM